MLVWLFPSRFVEGQVGMAGGGEGLAISACTPPLAINMKVVKRSDVTCVSLYPPAMLSCSLACRSLLSP